MSTQSLCTRLRASFLFTHFRDYAAILCQGHIILHTRLDNLSIIAWGAHFLLPLLLRHGLGGTARGRAGRSSHIGVRIAAPLHIK